MRQARVGGQFRRRELMRGGMAATVGLGSTALVGCGVIRQAQSRFSGGAGSASGEGRRGGTVVHAGGNGVGGTDTEGVELDPHISPPAAARGFRLVYQGLLGYDLRTYAVQRELAVSWEQASPTEVILTLQNGAKWQRKAPANGRVLTVDDVVFSLNRVRTDDPKFTQASLFANFDKVEAVDKARVRVTTKTPDATVLTCLSADPAMVMAPEVVQKNDKILSPEAVVGTGPFILKTLDEKSSAQYVRDPAYWKSGRPYLDAVQTQHMADDNAAFAAFQGGQLDVMVLPGAEVKGYISKQGSNYKPDWFNDETTVQAFPNVRSGPMVDARVTRALRLLIDHRAFNSAWAEPQFGHGSFGSIFCPALQSWDLSQDEYGALLEWKQPKDDAVTEALRLLSAAGYTKDKPLSFELAGVSGGFLSAATQLLQMQWSQLSQGAVNATIKEYDDPTQVLSDHSFTYFILGNSGGLTDPDAWLTALYRSTGPKNYGGSIDPTVDSMIDQQRTLFDTAQRHAVVKQIVQYMIDYGDTTIPANRQFLNGVKPRVQDFAPEFYINGRQYEWVWLST